MSDSPRHQVASLGQSAWIDFLSRDLVRSGELERMVEQDAIAGVTSNPTIFQQALATGESYDSQLSELAGSTVSTKELFVALGSVDVSEACDVLADVHAASNGVDGFVSFEVDPTLAYDAEATIAEAARLHDDIDKPNLYVKIPATKPGLTAIEEMIARGRSINVTLIFSLERYTEVVEAYLRGLERFVAAGGDPARVASVASFFVSRVDSEADRRLDELGGHDELKGKLAIANARLAYQHYLDVFSSERWDFLASKGARPQRCLWASTSTKNPEYRDVMYVEDLIGPNTVNTMPESTIRAFQDHGEAAVRLTQEIDDARATFDALAAAGVDYDDVTELLEREGVDKFIASFEELLAGIEGKRATVTA
ncbi:MAG: transaldolase [Gaiellaceae bacterium]